jgi:uncharacterized tellurite resistance protein B-like protein
MEEPALIDPSLPISTKPQDQELPYWPSYCDLTPAQRGEYLKWLANGRQDVATQIGYIFLFMYGFERRIFVDMAANSALEQELPAILSEMKRLLRVYGSESGSFLRYGSAFLDVIELMMSEEGDFAHAKPPALADTTYDVPVTLRIGLGRFAASGAPIPADWALAWGWFHPEIHLRTPARRCPEEFVRLFKIRYSEGNGEGLVVRSDKSKIRQKYHAASAGIGTVSLRMESIPEIFNRKAPGRKLTALFNSVTDELDAYSRWIGRNPEKIGSLASSALLPSVLLSGSRGELKTLRDWANRHLDHEDPIQVPGQELLDLWSSPASEKFSKPDAVSLAQLLEHLGVGMEPDVRFGGKPVGQKDTAVLFRNRYEVPHTATPAYGAAMTLVHLAAVVGAADGQISRSEVKHLGDHVASSLRLTSVEITRLYAHLVWLSGVDIKLTGLKRRLSALTESQRSHIGNVVITLAAADGVITPEEVTTLLKTFKILGLDQGTVTSRLHAAQTTDRSLPAESPVIVRDAGVQEPGYAIPPRQQGCDRSLQPSQGSIRLDERALERIEGETAAVSLLLGDIFGEDQKSSVTNATMFDNTNVHGAVTATQTIEDRLVQGLDVVHSNLLRALAERDQWTWAEVEELAATYHVLPEGAMDVINEAAFEAAEEPVIEGDERLTINAFAMREMLS